MPRIPRVTGRKVPALRVGDLDRCMATFAFRIPSPIRSPDRRAALRKGRETQYSARRLATVFAELDRDLS